MTIAPISDGRARRVLIGTVGGQGGGVLSQWLVSGLLKAGWNARSTGLLGLSQRAGTVTYYCEAYPGIATEFVPSMYATPGDVDLVLAQELLELGRILSQGFASEDASIVGNSARYLTTREKMPAENGIYDYKIIEKAVRCLAPDRHYVFDAQKHAVEAGLSPLSSNAVLLGAAVASPAFSLSPATFIEAIKEAENNVDENIRAFELGYRGVRDGTLPRFELAGQTTNSGDLDDQIQRNAEKLTNSRERAAYARLVSVNDNLLDGDAESILPEAVYRLIDYQDESYAEDFITRVRTFREAIGDYPDTVGAYARHLALWMAYEDIARVAQLKSHPSRFATIRSDFGVGSGPYVVTDYLVPDMDQILGSLPKNVSRIIHRLGIRLIPKFEQLKFPLRIRSNRFFGYWSMRALASQRKLRRLSHRHYEELEMIQRWEQAVLKWAKVSSPLGHLAADAARVVRGYGRTRRDALDDLWSFLQEGMERLQAIDSGGGDVRCIGAEALKILAARAGSFGDCSAYLQAELKKSQMEIIAVSTAS